MCELTLLKFQSYLRDQTLNLATMPFLYSKALLLNDLSNTGKDFMYTLYTKLTTAVRPRGLQDSLDSQSSKWLPVIHKMTNNTWH
jgi:hypothetical protein